MKTQYAMIAVLLTRLNPFEFRAGLKARAQAAQPEGGGLNPFEFRAGLKWTGSWCWSKSKGLNPFEFRAGLKFKAEKSITHQQLAEAFMDVLHCGARCLA